jgi:type VI secretion system protein ImpA
MTVRWNAAGLLEPITAEAPCGTSLEDTAEFALLDSYQIFGQNSLDPVERQPGDPVPKETRKSKSDRPPNWEEVGDLSVSLLARSKDLRVLAHLGAAHLRTNGFPDFVETLSIAARWLADHWAQVYPLADEDAVFRRNALNYFADRPAVIEGLRRVPLVNSRQHGRFSLRDLEGATGAAAPPAESDGPPASARIDAAFNEMPIGELRALQAGAAAGLAALQAIDELTRSKAGIEAAPSFEVLVAAIEKLNAALQARLAVHPEGVAPAAGAAAGAERGPMAPVGAIQSRQDAIRALEAVAEFFRRNEPSSPLPLLVDRAKRLVAKDFLEVLADVAPEALPSARAAGGIRES